MTSLTRTPDGLDRPWFHYSKALGIVLCLIGAFAGVFALIFAFVSQF
jgi:hypothetical protein